MLIRITLALKSSTLRSRIEGLLPADDVAVDFRHPDEFWNDPPARPFDLVMMARPDLPVNPTIAVQQIRLLPFKPDIAVLRMDTDPEDTLELQGAGCLAILPMDQDDGRIHSALARLLQRRRETMALTLAAANAPQPLRIDDLVSKSPAMQEVLAVARRVATSDTSLLLLGETGTGKEWVARAVHSESSRSNAQFVTVNCGAIPESLLESELFGHERGAFTGAVRSRRGYFELAHGGTLFLDEIGEMAPALQVRLLRALENRTIQRLGSEGTVTVDVRLIAATHRDLAAAIRRGEFRQDFYYRLAVVPLTMPPLRDRTEDIPDLVHLYLERFTAKLARPEIRGIKSAAMAALEAYDWPGNVRELVNVLERAVLLAEGERIGLEDLPTEIGTATSSGTPNDGALSPTFAEFLEQPVESGRQALVQDFETRYFTQLLKRHRGHLGHTAAHAGINARTLYNKMLQLGLDKGDFKPP